MSKTKYLLFLHVGDRQGVANKIKNAVKRSGMAMSIPMVKFERGSDRQFYLGLAVQVSDPLATAAPAEILQFCRDTGLGRPIGPLVEASEINGNFMSGNISWESFNESIRFEPSFEPPDDVELVEEPCTHEIATAIWDQLLWWCSAQGNGSFQLFRQVAGLLLRREDTNPWHLMRRLALQGHIEVERSGRTVRWRSNRPIFICMSNERAFLLGRQTPRYLRQLEEVVGLERFTPNGAPTLISAATPELLAFESSLALLGVAVAHNPSRDWASVLPGWRTFAATLERDPDVREHSESFRIWNGDNFQPTNPRDGGIGLYEIIRQHDKRVRLFNGKEWLAGPFYDLQWILMRLSQQNMYVVLRLDGMLLVPEEERWPLLYERALVSFSARIPTRFRLGERSYLGYVGVGPEEASNLCANLEIILKSEALV